MAYQSESGNLNSGNKSWGWFNAFIEDHAFTVPYGNGTAKFNGAVTFVIGMMITCIVVIPMLLGFMLVIAFINILIGINYISKKIFGKGFIIYKEQEG